MLNGEDCRLTGQFYQGHFDHKLGIGSLLNILFSTEREGEEPLHVFQRPWSSLTLDGSDFVIGQIRQRRQLRIDLHERDIAKMFEEIVTETAWVIAVLVQISGEAQRGGWVTVENRVHDAHQCLPIRNPKRIPHCLFSYDPSA